MMEKHGHHPEAVRADETGYYFIFEVSKKGEVGAEMCWELFRTWKFRTQKMHMHFSNRGTAMDDV